MLDIYKRSSLVYRGIKARLHWQSFRQKCLQFLVTQLCYTYLPWQPWLGQVRLGQVRLGQVRLGQVRLGQIMLPLLALATLVRLGQVRLGQVRLGQVRLGQVRLGQVRLGTLLVLATLVRLIPGTNFAISWCVFCKYKYYSFMMNALA